MKKSLAVFFLVIMLLNTAGYYLVFEGWKWRYSESWSFDEESSNAQEMIITIPVNVPYAGVKDWEKADGQFEYKGELYRIVKQKLTLDAVFIGCVKDDEGSRINQQLEDYARTFGTEGDGSTHSTKIFPGFIKEYLSSVITVRPSVPGWTQKAAFNLRLTSFIPSYQVSIVHPPERA